MHAECCSWTPEEQHARAYHLLDLLLLLITDPPLLRGALVRTQPLGIVVLQEFPEADLRLLQLDAAQLQAVLPLLERLLLCNSRACSACHRVLGGHAPAEMLQLFQGKASYFARIFLLMSVKGLLDFEDLPPLLQ